MESVFHVSGSVPSAEKARAVRFIFREQQFWLTGAQQPALAVLPVLQFSAGAPRHGGSFSRERGGEIPARGQGGCKPKLREDVQSGGFGPAIYRGDSDENVFDVGFGILDENVKIAVPGENSRVEQFKLRLTTAATLALLQQGFVRKFRLRIFVEHAHVAVRGCRVEVKVIFLDVLAMIALISRKAKKPFFQNVVASIPQRQPETDHLVQIADSAEAVLSPAIRARTRGGGREQFASGAARTVMLADGSPLPLRQIGPPALPMFLAGACFLQPAVFGGLNSWHRSL